MPNSVDNKIVEMQFDNANFEKNVRQSIKTLETLNKALELEDAAKGFEQMEKAANSIDLSKLMSAADVIEKRFSAAGIAGAALIQRGVNGAINLVEKLGSTVVGLAKRGGINRALNLEHANFMLQGLIKDSARVAAIINGPVNNAVSGTAYGLDAAANAAAQFVASGVTDMKKLENALTGISGVAAMTGAEYADVAAIFTTVAGQGKVMTRQFRQIEARGLNAAAALGKYLNKSEAEIRDMVTKGKISFDEFAEAMNDAFGDQAKKANETFTGAMSNVKAALSRIGAKIATPTLENLRRIFVTLIEVINKINTLLSSKLINGVNKIIDRISLLTRVMLSSSKFMTLVEKIVDNLTNGFEALMNIMRPFKLAFRAIFPGDVLDKLIGFNDGLSSLIKMMDMSADTAVNLQFTLQGIYAVIDILLTLAKQVLEIILPGTTKLYDATDSLAEKILNITGFIGFMLTKFDKWLKQNNVLKIGIDAVKNALSKLTDQTNIFWKVIQGIGLVIGGVVYIFYLIGSAIVEFIKQAYQLPAVQNIVNDLKNAILKLGELAAPVLLMVAAGFVSLIDSLEKFAQGQYLTTGLEKLNDVLNNAYWGMKNVSGAIGAFFNIFKKGDNTAEKIEKVAVASEKLYGSAEALGGKTNVVVRNIDGVTTAVTTMADTTEEVADKTAGAMMTLDKAGHMFAIGFGASVISAGVNIGRGFREIGRVARNLKSTTKSISLFFNQLQLNLRIKTLMALAGTIVIFAGALALLTQLDPGRLALAAVIVGSLMAALAILGKGLAKSDSLSIKRFQTASKGIFELAGAVLVLALAAKLLSTAVGSWKQLGSMIAGMIATVVLMGALSVAVVYIGNKQTKAIAGASAMLAIAGSIYIVMASLQKLANLDYEKIWKALPLVLSIIGGMAAIAVAMTFVISPFGGLAFLGVVAGVLLLMEGLQMLQSVNPKVIIQAQMIIDQIVAGITHIIWALALVQALKTAESVFNWLPWIGTKMSNGLKGMFAVLQKGVKYIGVAAIILAIGVSIKMIGDTLIALGALWQQDKAAMIAGVGFVAGIASLILAMTESLAMLLTATFEASMYAKEIGPALLGIAALIISFVAAVAIFGNMSPEVLIKGLGTLVIFEALILGFVALLSMIQKEVGPMLEGSQKTLIGLAVFVGLMVAAVAVLGIIPIDDAWRGVAMLALLMGALMGVLAALSLMKDMTTQATVAVFGLSAIFVALGVVAVLINGVDTGQLIANLIVLEVAVAAMAGIIFLLSDDKINFEKGLLVVIGITAVIAVLAKVATVLEKVNPERLKSSFIVLGEALAVLAVAMGILGAIASTKIGGAAIAAGIVVLTALASVLMLVSAAAINFGTAAQMIGEGLTKVAYAIKDIEHADFDNLSGGLKELKDALSGISNISTNINQSADAMQRLAPAISDFGNSLLIMTGSIKAFTEMDLNNIMVNLIKLGQAISFVNERALQFGEFSIIAIAVGASCGVLGAGLVTASAGMIGFAAAIDLVCIGISFVVSSFSTLGNIVINIADSLTKMVTSLKSLGAQTVSEIYDTLTEYASTQLFEAGQSMMIYIQNGFKEAIDPATSEILTSMIDGFGTQLALRETEVYGIGYKMAEYFKLGMLDSFEINSPSRVSMRNVDYIVAGYEVGTDNNASAMESAGYSLGESYGKGLKEAAEDAGEDSVSDTANTMRKKSNEYEHIAYSAGETLGEAFDKGVRDPSGSYCENITGDEVPYDTAYTMDVKSEAYAYMAENGGNTLGTAFTDGVASSVNTGLSGISAAIREWAKDPMKFKGGSLLGVDPTNGIGQKLKNLFGDPFEEYKKAQEKAKIPLNKGKGDLTRENRYWAGTGVGWVNRQGQKQEDFDINKYLNKETDALEGSGGNTGATKKNTKAKKENEKANDNKTKAINEETEALDEETEAVEDNEQEIRDQAEQIEIVTERFKEYLKTFGKTDSLKNATRLTKSFSTLWSAQDKTISDVSKTYKATSKSLTNSFKTINKQVIKFNDSGKYLGKFSKSLYKNSKKIEDRVTKTGKTIMKVMGPVTKVFFKAGNSVEKMVISTTKNVKKLGKQFEAAKNFVNSFNADITNVGDSESFILTLRSIEKYFGANKFKQMTGKVKGYLSGLVNEFDDVRNSMNMLAKNVDGVGNVLSKNSKSTAYVVDGFMALAASLYDGSEAANEYETEHARLLFLLENGLATEEEVAEHFQSYVSRIKDALVEYRTSVQENLTGSMDIWSKFNQNLLEEGTDLISNIESQIAGYYNWSNMLMELSKRGLDVNILKILTDEGVSSFGKAKGLLEMTRAELALFTEDYQMSQAVIEHATDTAIAAMANAQTQASLRAAAAQGNKTAQAQLKQSAKNKKAMMDDIKAVADYRVKYNKLTKKQEKEYLKSLTKEQQKEYKKQVKAAKKAQKEQTKLAKNERANRAEKERLKGIMDSIKALSDYINVTREYSNDSKVMTDIATKMTEAFKPLQETFPDIAVGINDSTTALFAFGETLEATGEEGLNYFEEIAKRIENFTNSIIDSIKSVDLLSTSFEKVYDISYKTMSDNAFSNIVGNEQIKKGLAQLEGMGYNREVIDKLVENIKNAPGTALAQISALTNASADEIRELNAYYELRAEQAKEIAKQTFDLVKGTTSKKILEDDLKTREANVAKAEEAQKKAAKSVSDYEAKLNDLRTQKSSQQRKLDTLQNEAAALKATKKLTAAQKKRLKALTGPLGLIAAQERKIYNTELAIGELLSGAEYVYKDKQKAEEELTKAIAEQEAARRRLSEYETAQAKAEELARKRATLRAWYEDNIKSLEAYKNALRSFAKSSDEFALFNGDLAKFLENFDGAVGTFEIATNFEGIKSLATVGDILSPVKDGLLEFAKSISEFDEGMAFADQIKVMTTALKDYQDSLEDSIRSSSDFFSMFKGFSDEENPLSIGKYLEYANSQVTALKEWSSMLMRVTDLGLNKDLVETLANKGLGSYEQLYALTNATADEIAQYNYLWEEYNKEIEKSTNAAMASIAAAWSDAGKNLQSSMIQAFVGSDEFEEAGYEASALVITGMKNGLEGGMTTIISAVEKNMSSTEMATSLGKSVGKSINEGLVQSIQTSVQDTVDAAIEKFKMAVDSVNEYVNATLQTEFTITVHVDTTEIDEAVARMNAAVSGINADARTTSQAVTTSQTNQAQANVTTTPEPTQVTNNVTFNQTNNSPKSLSQVDIYRNTKNQLNQTAVALGMAGS